MTQIHPQFNRKRQNIGLSYVLSSKELIDLCDQVEKSVPAPFSIFIHGDFNTNNVVYDHSEQKINYIDLYRSRYADYVQDASVFLISYFRLPVFEPKLRQIVNNIINYFFKLFSDFAKKNNDRTFEIRMALALARSFYTSTRFELNYDFASEMFLRAHFLMERIAERESSNWENFKLPEKILFY